MFLFRPFGAKTIDAQAVDKRVSKSLGTLYRMMSEEFERSRACDCSCKMPILFHDEAAAAGQPNWQVETLWCGCRECQETLDRVVARNARLFDVKPPERPEDEAQAAGAAP